MSENGKEFNPNISFSIIKQRGDPKTATTLDGHVVHKEEKVFVPEWNRWVACADYHGEHFVYLDPSDKPGRWFAMCTCGSPAVIVGKDVYKGEQGMLVCHFHAAQGYHQTSDGRTWR